MSSAARIGGFGAALIAAWLVAPSVRADIVSDEEGVCHGKAKGDACEVRGKVGTCADATCSFNDYSAGTPPKAGQRPCLQCVLGNVTKDAQDAEDPPTPAKTDEKTADAKPADADPIDATPTDAKPADAKSADVKSADAKPADAKPADAKTDASKSSASGCNVEGATHGAAILLGLGLLVLARRDRRRAR